MRDDTAADIGRFLSGWNHGYSLMGRFATVFPYPTIRPSVGVTEVPGAFYGKEQKLFLHLVAAAEGIEAGASSKHLDSFGEVCARAAARGDAEFFQAWARALKFVRDGGLNALHPNQAGKQAAAYAWLLAREKLVEGSFSIFHAENGRSYFEVVPERLPSFDEVLKSLIGDIEDDLNEELALHKKWDRYLAQESERLMKDTAIPRAIARQKKEDGTFMDMDRLEKIESERRAKEWHRIWPKIKKTYSPPVHASAHRNAELWKVRAKVLEQTPKVVRNQVRRDLRAMGLALRE
jgi:hypothetical protein